METPNLFAFLICDYQEGSVGTVVAAAADRDSLEMFSVPDHGIAGSFGSVVEVEPSKRIKTIAAQGGKFGLCSDDCNIGAWLNGKPHTGAYKYSERHGPRWTWTVEEQRYLEALLASRGEFGEYATTLRDGLAAVSA